MSKKKVLKPSKTLKIREKTSDNVINIILDTISKNKQAIVFCNTKRGAESQAEKIAKKIKELTVQETVLGEELAEQALKALSNPTKQCKRLALCLKKEIAFHHSGLAGKQRELIEDNFRDGRIKVICSTPTLAMGLDLPAFRTIIKDLKRFSTGRTFGMNFIPVLEYEQQAGRAGRPGKEDYGEAICMATTDDEEEKIVQKYLLGEPEAIISKLAVEPVLRTYVLSLIASEFITTKQRLYDFFENTFYAKQYGNTTALRNILDKVLSLLEEWGFIIINSANSSIRENKSGFMSANYYLKTKNDDYKLEAIKLEATLIGKRVSQLYLDPLTANTLIGSLKKINQKTTTFSLNHLLSNCLEIRPLLRVKTSETDEIANLSIQKTDEVLIKEPMQFGYDYERYLETVKTAKFLEDWIDETNEERLLEEYGVRPGELKVKLDIADWLLYSSEELSRLMKMHSLKPILAKLRLRLKHGAREELLPLLRLKGIGKIRARKLYHNKITDLKGVQDIDITSLVSLLGKSLAINVKKQVGQEFEPEKIIVSKKKRKGQMSLLKYG